MSFNLFDWYYGFVTDAKKKVSHRISTTILIVLGILMVDNVLGLSFNYKLNNKLNQLEKASSIINNSNSDSTSRQYAIILRKRVIERETWFDYLFSRTASFASKYANTKNPTAIAKAKESIKSQFWLYVSSAGLFLILACSISLGVIFVEKFKGFNDFAERVYAAFFVGVVVYLPGYLLYRGLRNLRVINDTLTINFIINGTVQLIAFFAMIFLFIWVERRNDK